MTGLGPKHPGHTSPVNSQTLALKFLEERGEKGPRPFEFGVGSLPFPGHPPLCASPARIVLRMICRGSREAWEPPELPRFVPPRGSLERPSCRALAAGWLLAAGCRLPRAPFSCAGHSSGASCRPHSRWCSRVVSSRASLSLGVLACKLGLAAVPASLSC